MLKKDIIAEMSKSGTGVTSSNLRYVISNLKDKKLKPAKLDTKIKIEYSKKDRGWSLIISR